METEEIVRIVVVVIFLGATIYALTHPEVFLD